MIRLVIAAVAIYLGAIVSASSYLPLLDDARTVAAPLPRDEQTRARRDEAVLPVAFVPDAAGQLDPRLSDHARDDRYALYLTRDSLTLAFLDRAPDTCF